MCEEFYCQGQIVDWVTVRMADADAGHGLDHVQRVVFNARRIGQQEHADLQVVLPAAWLHDCVIVAKNSPQRSKASRLAAEEASRLLRGLQYPEERVGRIAHCIQSHSFSAGIECQTIEARVVQDADRLEALGAIGLARCLMTGGALRQRLYDPDEPLPVNRIARDDLQSVDHFFAKLLKLEGTLQTRSGRLMAQSRTEFLVQFLRQWADEIGLSQQRLSEAISSNA